MLCLRIRFEKNFRKVPANSFDPRISAILLDLMDEGHLEDVTGKYKEMENSLYMDSNHTINKFISDVFTTIKSQEDITSYDFLTGLPLRTLGEKTNRLCRSGSQWMSCVCGYG